MANAQEKDATKELLEDEVVWALTHGLTLTDVIRVVLDVNGEVEKSREAAAGGEG